MLGVSPHSKDSQHEQTAGRRADDRWHDFALYNETVFGQDANIVATDGRRFDSRLLKEKWAVFNTFTLFSIHVVASMNSIGH